MEITPSNKQRLLVEHKLEIGKFLFYDNIVVGEFSQGVHVSKENAIEPIVMAQEFYGIHKPIVYISNRKNSYSLDAMSYKEIEEIFPNFKGYCIVSKNRYRRMLVSIEELFIKKPIGVFDNLDSAFVWAENILLKNS